MFTVPVVAVMLTIQMPIDARATVEQYVTAALGGKTDDAAKLAVEGQSPAKAKKIEEFKHLVAKDKLPLATVLASDGKKYAVAVSDAVKLSKPNADGQDAGVLVFVLVKRDGEWRVKDIDFRDAEKAKKLIDDMKKVMPDAVELKAKKT